MGNFPTGIQYIIVGASAYLAARIWSHVAGKYVEGAGVVNYRDRIAKRWIGRQFNDCKL
jgi:hypothetical protein